MLRVNALKRKLAARTPAYGLFASIPSPASIELIAEAGFDFVIIDTEHVLINPETVENMIRTAESYDLTPLVRVADGDPKTMLRLLDGGAQGIVLPMVEQAEQVREAVAACFYHPRGVRSLNAGRPGAFGKESLAEYVRRANQEILLVAMVESGAGVAQAEAIAAVDGVDMDKILLLRSRGFSRQINVSTAVRLLIACVALLGLLLLSLCLGKIPLSPWAALQSLADGRQDGIAFIVTELRLPRSLLAMLVGGALALSGLLLQAMIRNPLASPDILGITSGASAATVCALSFPTVALGAGYLPLAAM